MTAYDYYKNQLGIQTEELLQELDSRSSYQSGKKGDVLIRQEVNEEAFDSVELVEDSTYFALSLADLMKLREKYPEISELYLTILERSWENQAQLKRARYTLDATQRYLWFTETYPGVENRMRQKDIASFLNMTTQVLSKIRTKYKSQKMV